MASSALVSTSVGCGESGAPEALERGPKVGDPGPVHVHGLGVNPRDGALFIATHTGLFRAGEGERKAKRVAGRFQDTMGFTVVGRDRFLGSGHPDGREKLPPFLGLIESRDAGETWRPVSLLGRRDFHVLEASGRHVFGFGFDFKSREAGLLVSSDGGRNWERRPAPEPLIALAVNPENPGRLIASGEKQTYESRDGGRGWRPAGTDPGLLAWPAAGLLYAVGSSGAVTRSGDGGRTWQTAGEVGGQPAAFEAVGAGELLVALHDGKVKRSTDGGGSWSLRSRP